MIEAVDLNSNELHTSRGKLILAGSQLFAEKWYGAVSVAEICRRASLSNGCFYRYFKSKEELFRAILDNITMQIDQALQRVQGGPPEARLFSFTEIVFNFSRDNPSLIHVFREGQYRFFECEQRLEDIYTAALGKVLGGPASQAEYEFALGGLRFAAIRSAFYGIPVKLEALQDILVHGLFPEMPIDEEMVFANIPSEPPNDSDQSAKSRLLREGRKLFGRLGYFETNIHQITDAAGLSVGAFYTHFESKEAFYGELISMVGMELRHFISSNLGSGLNRLEKEIRGLWLFIVYLQHDPNCYNIVREAEFVLPDTVRAYYDAFANGYRKHPEGSGGLDETTSIEFLIGVAHYFGLSAVFNKSAGEARSRVLAIGRLLREGLNSRLSQR